MLRARAPASMTQHCSAASRLSTHLRPNDFCYAHALSMPLLPSRFIFLPAGALPDANRLIAARGLHAFGGGFAVQSLLALWLYQRFGLSVAAAGITTVPRSLAAALSPALAGYMLTVSGFGWPLVVCGALKIVYDLALLKMFQAVRPPEEKRESP